MSEQSLPKGITRRQFLTRVGTVAGAAALYETMVALGMINLPTAWAGPPQLGEQQGEGQSVLILGAGIGGLTTAYILSRHGYQCTVLEASDRAGGRNRTARRGDVLVEESEEHGRTEQRCGFDEGLYMNLGPGRLPYHHRRVLGYCKELGVALEPYVMNTTANLFQSSKGFDGQAQPYREIQNNARGFISELLAKAVNQGALDQDLSAEDRQRLLELLRRFGNLGALDPEQPFQFQGTTRSGCAPDPEGNPTPNVFYSCQESSPGSIQQLLDSDYWQNSFYDQFEYEWQPTLFQPVGGMDKIVDGFMRQVGHLVRLNAPVSAIENGEDGVTVTYLQDGNPVVQTADYCVSNIPTPILNRIISDNQTFDASFREAVAGSGFQASCKVGWQSNTRFWEHDPTDIYGGISWTDDIIEQIWYPSNDYFTDKGTLTGAYIHDNPKAKNATLFGTYSLEKRLQVARAGGAKLHPEFEDDSIIPEALGLSVAWQNVPHQEGAWPDWGTHQHHDRTYRRLLLGDGRFHVVGDQTSTLPGWQEGAMMSAEYVISLIAGQLDREDIPEDIEAPNTFKITQGHGYTLSEG